MSELSELVEKGFQIRIMGCDEELDPTLWEVTGRIRGVFTLKDVETGKPYRVHRSRVAEIVEPRISKEVKGKMETPTPETTEPKPMEKKVVKKKPAKAKVERVAFKALIADGNEVWSKLCKFTDKEGNEIEGVKAESHCIIAPDKDSYRVFNTYNGAMHGKNVKVDAKKHPMGVAYPLKDEKALEKKRKDLGKKEYKRRKK